MADVGQHDDADILKKLGTMRTRFICGLLGRARHAQSDCRAGNQRQIRSIRPLRRQFVLMGLHPSPTVFFSIDPPLRPQNQRWFSVDIEGEMLME